MTTLLAPTPKAVMFGQTGTPYYSSAQRKVVVTDAADIQALLDQGCEYQTDAAATLLDDATVAAMRTTLGVGTGDQVTFAGVLLTGVAVAGLPSAATAGAGAVMYCTNGNAGAKCLVVSDGTNFKVVALGATASAT